MTASARRKVRRRGLMGHRDFLLLWSAQGISAIGSRITRTALPMAASGWKRIFLGNAMDVEIDASSRVLIAPELRTAAGLSRDVMLLGMGSHFELWDAARYAEHEAKVMAEPMPEALQSFSF